MKRASHIVNSKMPRFIIMIMISLLTACQSAPPAATNDIDSDVCIGEAVVVDPDKPVDLEEMAKQTDCE